MVGDQVHSEASYPTRHPEERALARVSKDARLTCGPSPFETAALRPPQGDGDRVVRPVRHQSAFT
jgi:hypothetical protein